MNVERWPRIYRESVRANPRKLFLFGDNYERHGLGGQAKSMRGEPNAYGIATKCGPGNSPGDYFTDDKAVMHINRMWAEFEGLRAELWAGRYEAVVIPADGLGTGLADLPNKAPTVFEFLQVKLKELEEL